MTGINSSPFVAEIIFCEIHNSRIDFTDYIPTMEYFLKFRNICTKFWNVNKYFVELLEINSMESYTWNPFHGILVHSLE